MHLSRHFNTLTFISYVKKSIVLFPKHVLYVLHMYFSFLNLKKVYFTCIELTLAANVCFSFTTKTSSIFYYSFLQDKYKFSDFTKKIKRNSNYIYVLTNIYSRLFQWYIYLSSDVNFYLV